MEEKNIDETYLESILGKEEEKIVDRLVEVVMRSPARRPKTEK